MSIPYSYLKYISVLKGQLNLAQRNALGNIHIFFGGLKAQFNITHPFQDAKHKNPINPKATLRYAIELK